jgi:hypothetical protein
MVRYPTPRQGTPLWNQDGTRKSENGPPVSNMGEQDTGEPRRHEQDGSRATYATCPQVFTTRRRLVKLDARHGTRVRKSYAESLKIMDVQLERSDSARAPPYGI